MSKSILITGASQGIGKAICTTIANDAHLNITKFFLLARNESKLSAVAQEIMAKHPEVNVKVVPVDLSDLPQVEKITASLLQEHGRIHFLINNAGFVDPQSILETTLHNLETTFKINLFAPFAIVRQMLAHRNYPERIINIASTAGMGPRPGWSAYASSKAALINLTETMAEELKSFKIKVVAIAPGRCATELRVRLAPDEDPSTIMQPSHVAEVVRHLLSEIGDYIDKQCLIVKG